MISISSHILTSLNDLGNCQGQTDVFENVLKIQLKLIVRYFQIQLVVACVFPFHRKINLVFLVEIKMMICSGLLHISNISRARINAVSEVLSEDDKVKVLVVRSMFPDKISLRYQRFFNWSHNQCFHISSAMLNKPNVLVASDLNFILVLILPSILPPVVFSAHGHQVMH